MRADKHAAEGTAVDLEFATNIIDVGTFKKSVTLTVVEKTEANLKPTLYTRSMKARDG